MQLGRPAPTTTPRSHSCASVGRGRGVDCQVSALPGEASARSGAVRGGVCSGPAPGPSTCMGSRRLHRRSTSRRGWGGGLSSVRLPRWGLARAGFTADVRRSRRDAPKPARPTRRLFTVSRLVSLERLPPQRRRRVPPRRPRCGCGMLGTVLARARGPSWSSSACWSALLDVPTTAFTVALAVERRRCVLRLGLGLVAGRARWWSLRQGSAAGSATSAGPAWSPPAGARSRTSSPRPCTATTASCCACATAARPRSRCAVLDAPSRRTSCVTSGEHLHRGHGYKPVPGARA